MQLTPRYGDRPILRIERSDDGAHPVIRQRRRLEASLGQLSAEAWQHPSRCDGWTVQDVVKHLVTTNGFWAASMEAGRAGQPTRFLATFDPVATPALLVDAAQGESVDRTMAQFVESNDAMDHALSDIGEHDWEALAEAPPGHLPLRLVADHALWDAWIHERDIFLPLGHTPVEADDEVRRCLRYAAGLGRAFALSQGDVDTRATIVEVTGPDDRIVVVADGDCVRIHGGAAPDGSERVTGAAVPIVELLSLRDIEMERPPGLVWLTDGLATVFNQSASG